MASSAPALNKGPSRVTRDGNKTYRNTPQQQVQRTRQSETPDKSKISVPYFILLIALSIYADILCAVIDDALPGPGELITLVIDPVIGAMFWFLFKLRGVNFSGNATRGVTIFAAPLASMILGIIPVLGWIEWTVEVVVVVLSVWNEEKKEREEREAAAM